MIDIEYPFWILIQRFDRYRIFLHHYYHLIFILKYVSTSSMIFIFFQINVLPKTLHWQGLQKIYQNYNHLERYDLPCELNMHLVGVV